LRQIAPHGFIYGTQASETVDSKAGASIYEVNKTSHSNVSCEDNFSYWFIVNNLTIIY